MEPRRRRVWPALILFFLSPMIGELLSGSALRNNSGLCWSASVRPWPFSLSIGPYLNSRYLCRSQCYPPSRYGPSRTTWARHLLTRLWPASHCATVTAHPNLRWLPGRRKQNWLYRSRRGDRL